MSESVDILRCPDDHTALHPHYFGDLEVDVCRTCGGMFYDPGELLHVASALQNDTEHTPDTKVCNVRERARSCPKDHTQMRTIQYAYSSSIPIDTCDACGSVWLDAHELNDIKKHLNKTELDVLDSAMAELTMMNLNSQHAAQNQSQIGLMLIAPFFSIPYADIHHRRKIPWMTGLFILLNSLVFFFYIYGADEAQLTEFFNTYAFSSGFAFDPTSFFRYLSSLFIHASIPHLIGNMLYVWVFGDNIEEEFGPLGFVMIYLFSGIIAALAFTAVSGPHDLAVGASGAISGLLGLYLILSPNIRLKVFSPNILVMRGILKHNVRIPAWWFIIFWFFLQWMLQTFTTQSGIGYSAHIGGFVFGLAIGVLYIEFFRKKRMPSS